MKLIDDFRGVQLALSSLKINRAECLISGINSRKVGNHLGMCSGLLAFEVFMVATWASGCGKRGEGIKRME